jgi:hypothetical protein
MNNFADFVTPTEAYRINKSDGPDCITLDEFIARSKVKGLCSGCRTEDVWRYAGTGMCFSCTTGEWDASGDYELIQGE